MQLSLSGEGEYNSEINKQITWYKESVDYMEWILSDKCGWNEGEMMEWFMREGGDLEEENNVMEAINELMSESIESLLKGRIKYLRSLIQELENEKVKGKW